MKPLTTLEGGAAPLPLANVDTDQIIPARFMKRPRSEGYGGFCLHDLREEAKQAGRALALDDAKHAGAEVLIARRNFGCGSSREAAVYAIADAGFRCVVAPSFGDIFASNSVKNGVLPARVSEEDAERLLTLATEQAHVFRLDLAEQTISMGNHVVRFDVDPVWKLQLLNGWDDIDMTLRYAANIEAFVAQDRAARPWAVPRAVPSRNEM